MIPMNKKLNILSIDWDYFIKADMSTRAILFPDCPNEKYPLFLQTIIWLSRYHTPKLEQIGLKDSAIFELQKLFDDAFFNPVSVMICDSHMHCYSFVSDLQKYLKPKGINLVNIDFHHDLYENGSDVDCGNWLYRLSQKYPKMEMEWVCDPDSDTSFEHVDDPLKLSMTEDISCIHNFNWDAVFICRSGMWSPPHLDRYFIELFDPLRTKYNCSFDPAAFEDRFGSRFQEALQNERRMINQIQSM